MTSVFHFGTTRENVRNNPEQGNACNSTQKVTQRPIAHAQNKTIPQLTARSSRKAKRKRSRIKWTLERACTRTQSLIRTDVDDFFVANYRAAVVDWISLLQNTQPEKKWPPSALHLKSVLQILGNVISGNGGLPPKFGFVRLHGFIQALEDQIQEQRELCSFVGKSGCGNATIAIKACVDAFEGDLSEKQVRRALKIYKRAATRWEKMNKESVFLLLVFSDAAEAIVYVLSLRLLDCSY